MAFISLPAVLQHNFPQNSSNQSPPRVTFQFYGIPMLFRVLIFINPFLLKIEEKLPILSEDFLKHQCFIYTCTRTLLLFPEQPKWADPQHFCGVGQCDQCQLSDQRSRRRCQSHTPPSYTQYGRINCPLK